MPGIFFVERWIDKFILMSTWLDGIHFTDVFTHIFFMIYFILAFYEPWFEE